MPVMEMAPDMTKAPLHHCRRGSLIESQQGIRLNGRVSGPFIGHGYPNPFLVAILRYLYHQSNCQWLTGDLPLVPGSGSVASSIRMAHIRLPKLEMS